METQTEHLVGDSKPEAQKTKLTKKLISLLTFSKSGNEKDIWWDTEIHGFGVRLYPTGTKSFVISYRINRRKRLMVLGKVGILTLDQARERARKELVKVIDGLDPMSKRDMERSGITIEQLSTHFIERYSKPHKKTWKSDVSMLNVHILPNIGAFLALSVTRDDITRLHTNIGKTTIYQANRCVELIKTMFNKASEWGYLPENYQNPANNIKAFKEVKRDRYVTHEELPKLAQSIDQEDNPYIRAALWLYLLTGLRKNELLSAKWEYIDWELGQIAIPNTKNGKTHYLPLSNTVLSILKSLPKLQDNPYILVGLKEGQHLVNISKPWIRIRKRAECDDVRLHDLRRTVGSWMAQSGNSLHLIGRVLNHSDSKSTEVYARFSQDNVRQALESHSKVVMGIVGKEKSVDIMDISQNKKKGTQNV